MCGARAYTLFISLSYYISMPASNALFVFPSSCHFIYLYFQSNKQFQCNFLIYASIENTCLTYKINNKIALALTHCHGILYIHCILCVRFAHLLCVSKTWFRLHFILTTMARTNVSKPSNVFMNCCALCFNLQGLIYTRPGQICSMYLATAVIIAQFNVMGRRRRSSVLCTHSLIWVL